MGGFGKDAQAAGPDLIDAATKQPTLGALASAGSLRSPCGSSHGCQTR